MKKILYLFILAPLLVLAQSADQNYVKKIIYKQATNVLIPAPTAQQANVNITYLDGLGRPIQNIAVGQSANATNIVTPITYDDFGRQDKDYLPVAVSTTSLDFTANSTIISAVSNYYSALNGSEGAYPYSEKRFESSPLNRVMEQAAPGYDWSMDNPDKHTVRFTYATNDTGEVKLFKANAIWNASTGLYNVSLINGNGTTSYNNNELYKIATKDENWKNGDNSNNTTEEFKDKEGRVVLKRNYNNNQAHDTYYVYDQYGNLSFVFPPKAEGNITTEILNGLCYQYKYDSRNRLVEKKLPGKQWEFIVYDKLDRVVATGPALAPFNNLIAQSKQGWMITKYDVFNRVILTAWKEFSSRVALQTIYNGATVFNETKSINPVTVNNIAFRYTNNVEPKTGYHVLTVNYYDNYDYVGAPANYIVTLDGLNQCYYNNSTQKPKGLPTGSWVRVLENSTDTKAEISYTLYDKKARPVKSYTTNHLNGYTSAEIKLDFVGKTLYTITKHKKDGVAVTPIIEIREDFTYSAQDRLLTHTHKIGSLPTQLLAANEYDALGQLIRKNVGGIDVSGNASLQKVDYSYNIRGWLKSINDVNELNPSTDPTDLSAFKINYNEVQNSLGAIIKPLYNGNISETFWKTDSDNTSRNYGYQYDNLNRLTAAIYQKANIATNAYNETLSYDKNGNIMHLNRTGHYDTTTGMEYPIDELTYSYKPSSNILNSVVDQTNSTIGFKDGATSGTDYEYDANGNMITDNNKNIDEISYNHLNLPTKIKFNIAGQNEINYLYNALGVKVAKTVNSYTIFGQPLTNLTNYVGSFQYLNNELQFFPIAEGYVSVTDGDKFNYVYNYTDHLGNIRLSYTKENDELKILEENHYYPFGLKHSYNLDTRKYHSRTNSAVPVTIAVDRSNYQYKYNGKEYQDELNLNLYDYGARNYDPAMGRWMNIDPKAELSRKWSPYNYCYSNPIFFVDPDGMDPIDNDDLNITGTQASAAKSELQKSVGSDITLNIGSSGAVNYTRNVSGPLTESAQQIANVIDDHFITVNVSAENTDTASNGSQYVGGAYMGNTVKDALTQTFQVNTFQEVNPEILGKASDYYGTPGADIKHELMESYIGGTMAKKSGIVSGDSNTPGSTYLAAHTAAEAVAPQSDIYVENLDKNGNNSGDKLYKTGSQTNFVQEGTRAPLILSTYPKR